MHCICWVHFNAQNSSVVENLYAERNGYSIPSSMSRVWNLFQIHQNFNVLQWDYKWFAAMKYFSVAHSNSWGCVKTNVHNSLARRKTGVLHFKSNFWHYIFTGHVEDMFENTQIGFCIDRWEDILTGVRSLNLDIYCHLNGNCPSTKEIKKCWD